MHAQYKLGLKFLHTWKTIKDSFLSKIYKTTFVDLFTLSNFASIHFFLKLCQLGDNWAEKNFGKYPTVEKRGWGGSVTIPPDQCSLIWPLSVGCIAHLGAGSNCFNVGSRTRAIMAHGLVQGRSASSMTTFTERPNFTKNVSSFVEGCKRTWSEMRSWGYELDLLRLRIATIGTLLAYCLQTKMTQIQDQLFSNVKLSSGERRHGKDWDPA